MKFLVAIPFFLLLFSACSPSPKAIVYGEDHCHFCKMTIVDHQHAAEAVTDKGKVFKFDAIECMVQYLGETADTEYAFLLVNDYEQPTVLIDAKTSHYLISEAIPSPMGAFLSAFASEEAAQKMQTAKGGKLYTWLALTSDEQWAGGSEQ